MGIKLKEIDEGYFEVVSGEELFEAWIEKFGYSRTFKNCDLQIKREEIQQHNVFVADGLIMFDFDSERDLVSVTEIESDTINAKVVEAALDIEFQEL